MILDLVTGSISVDVLVLDATTLAKWDNMKEDIVDVQEAGPLLTACSPIFWAPYPNTYE
jgi:hypothetical protein